MSMHGWVKQQVEAGVGAGVELYILCTPDA